MTQKVTIAMSINMFRHGRGLGHIYVVHCICLYIALWHHLGRAVLASRLGYLGLQTVLGLVLVKISGVSWLGLYLSEFLG